MRAGRFRRALQRAVELAFAGPRPARHEEPRRQEPPTAASEVIDPEVGVDIGNVSLLRGWSLDGAHLHLQALAADDTTDRARERHGHPPRPKEKPVEKTLDIRPLPPRERHPLIFETFEELALDVGFVLVNDHDPKPLYYHFEAEYGESFGWEYLERGPETWKVRISKVA